MKRIIAAVFAMVLISMLIQVHKIYAQDMKGHIFVVTTHHTLMPQDGSEQERDAMLKELFEVDKNNPKVISSRELRHYYGNDSHDWVVITEYANWQDIDEANKISDELYKKKWPDKKERDAFFKKLGKYFAGHSDEIYQELPEYSR
ncbi:MAG: hypothetical protein P8184_13935 [Calditrichia bacterium]